MTKQRFDSSRRKAWTAYAGLHALADDDPRWSLDPVEQARQACRGGAHVVQLRAKHATDREALAWGRQIRSLTSASGALFVVNDRFDIALACSADAVHLGQTDLPPLRLPTTARDRLAVGRSTHTLEQARAATREAVDYVAFGPIYGTQSKDSEYGERGVDLLAEIVRLVAPQPVVAIGGIQLERLEEIFATGAAGAAVISAIASAEKSGNEEKADVTKNAESATRELVARVELLVSNNSLHAG